MPATRSSPLAELWIWFWAVGEERVHWRRYLLGAALSVVGYVALAAAYMIIVPKKYTSEWSVILPGAGAETRVDIDRIGQAQSSSSSPFSDKSLSPKVNYKEIAVSRPVLEAAAKAVDIPVEKFTEPRIKLIDQASIILFEVTAKSPQDAQRRSFALFDAFKKRLDELRGDEIATKNMALRENIGSVEVALKSARKRLLELQEETGLASIDQYNQLVSSIENLRREQANARATLAEKTSGLDSLRHALGLDLDAATRLLGVSADPNIRNLTTALANANATYAEFADRFGPAHPRVIEAQQKTRSIKSALGDELRKFPEVERLNVETRLIDNDRLLELLSSVVQRSAEKAGLEARLSEIDRIMADLEVRRHKLGAVAARLDDLQRDHMIANAVFSSALARLDASKSDHYGSYPMAQMLSEPTLPDRPSSPRLLFAALGAIAGSILSSATWFFAWLHQWFVFEQRMRWLRREELAHAELRA